MSIYIVFPDLFACDSDSDVILVSFSAVYLTGLKQLILTKVLQEEKRIENSVFSY